MPSATGFAFGSGHDTDTTGTFTLGASEQHAVAVAFAPQEVGPHGADIVFVDGAGAALDTLVLSGTGTLAATETARYYYLRDHLGSVRATVNEAGTVVHYDDYYPFGMPMPGRSDAQGDEGDPTGKPRFTGHEQEVDIDAEFKAVYYAGARYYDGLIGRWMSVDPLAEKHPDWTPYNYVLGNPLRLVDPDGRQVVAPLLRAPLTDPITGQPRLHGEADSDRVNDLIDIGGGFIPYIGEAGDAKELLTGKTLSGQEGSRFAAGFSLVLPLVGSFFTKKIGRALFGGGSVNIPKGVLSDLGIDAASIRVTAGTSDKIAIIGRGQSRVRSIAQEIGANAVIFKPSPTAKSQWRHLQKVYGGNVPREVVKKSLIYKENQKWISNVKAKNHTVVDIGSRPGDGPSEFYELEREVIYGTDN